MDSSIETAYRYTPPTRSIFLLIESGLIVSFTKDSLSMNNLISGRSTNEVKEYIELI